MTTRSSNAIAVVMFGGMAIVCVVVELPSFERAPEFDNSHEYQAAKKVREGAATAQFVRVEGM